MGSTVYFGGGMKQAASPHPIHFLIPAIWIFWTFGFQTVGERLWTEIDGTVIESHDLPSTKAPRYVTQYIIRGADGQNKTYTAGPTDAHPFQGVCNWGQKLKNSAGIYLMKRMGIL